ncbi:MAG: pyridoxal-phosphate dependent enzyme [Candidatus Binataceae bacterium]
MRHSEILDRFERFVLGHSPTPLETLARMSAHLGGSRILVKRDDCTGLALGGNKVRKLEYLIADARIKGATTVITVGGVQSNHARQTAAMIDAVRLCARLEVLLLDPVYTGKAMAGLIAMVRSGEIAKSETVVFLHTGGIPALFAYGDVFRSSE